MTHESIRPCRHGMMPALRLHPHHGRVERVRMHGPEQHTQRSGIADDTGDLYWPRDWTPLEPAHVKAGQKPMRDQQRCAKEAREPILASWPGGQTLAHHAW